MSKIMYESVLGWGFILQSFLLAKERNKYIVLPSLLPLLPKYVNGGDHEMHCRNLV